MHCFAMTVAAISCTEPQLVHALCWSKWLKVGISALTVVAAPIAEKLHPTRQTNEQSFDVAGLTQYLTVGLYVFFFALYRLLESKESKQPELQLVNEDRRLEF
eukprot:g17520.t1